MSRQVSGDTIYQDGYGEAQFDISILICQDRYREIQFDILILICQDRYREIQFDISILICQDRYREIQFDISILICQDRNREISILIYQLGYLNSSDLKFCSIRNNCQTKNRLQQQFRHQIKKHVRARALAQDSAANTEAQFGAEDSH